MNSVKPFHVSNEDLESMEEEIQDHIDFERNFDRLSNSHCKSVFTGVPYSESIPKIVTFGLHRFALHLKFSVRGRITRFSHYISKIQCALQPSTIGLEPQFLIHATSCGADFPAEPFATKCFWRLPAQRVPGSATSIDLNAIGNIYKLLEDIERLEARRMGRGFSWTSDEEVAACRAATYVSEC